MDEAENGASQSRSPTNWPYDVSGDSITIHPLVAKIPVVMKPAANEVYHFRIEGKTLTLRQVRNARGVAVDSAPTIKFVRVE